MHNEFDEINLALCDELCSLMDWHDVTSSERMRQDIKTSMSKLVAAQRHTKTIQVLVQNLVTMLDEINDQTDGRYPSPSPGCVICTEGATPDKFNTGLCALHRAKQLLRY